MNIQEITQVLQEAVSNGEELSKLRKEVEELREINARLGDDYNAIVTRKDEGRAGLENEIGELKDIIRDALSEEKLNGIVDIEDAGVAMLLTRVAEEQLEADVLKIRRGTTFLLAKALGKTDELSQIRKILANESLGTKISAMTLTRATNKLKTTIKRVYKHPELYEEATESNCN